MGRAVLLVVVMCCMLPSAIAFAVATASVSQNPNIDFAGFIYSSKSRPNHPNCVLSASAADDNHHDASGFKEHSLPASVIESSQRVSFDGAETEQLHITLVKKGLEFDAYRGKLDFDGIWGRNSTATSNDEVFFLVSPLARVPGCVANVNIRSILSPVKSSSSTQQYRVLLDGDADAMLSRGLLALLSELLSGGEYFDDVQESTLVTADDVLRIDSESVADILHLRHVLSKGRNDGLASMLRVVQNQIQSLLQNNVDGSSDSVSSDLVAESDPHLKVSGDNKSHPTVAMLLSGGVDSSVALNLLTRQGYHVTAFYLKIWLEDELAHLGQCPWEDDYRMCQAVCEQASVPLETVSLQEEYKERVISYTVQVAQRGRTPNPDIMCNSRVKFGCFYDAIQGRGFDYVASGHYAQLIQDEETGLRRLMQAPDPVKDQSYFLCALTQEQLERVLFPIGGFQKSEVRALAEEFDLPNKHRPDSQGLCFLGKVKFDEFLAVYLGNRPGNIVDASTGDVLGRHNGIWYHTIGQRKGIGKVLDPKATSRGPWYVVAKDPERDTVFVSNQYEEDMFTAARSDFYVEDIRWIAGSRPSNLLRRGIDTQMGRFRMKIRHGPTKVEGTLELTEDEAGKVRLDKKDGGLAPGQFVVFYTMDDHECLGGGVISERHWAEFLSDSDFVSDTKPLQCVNEKD